jgi:cyclohexanone monooxygenase
MELRKMATPEAADTTSMHSAPEGFDVAVVGAGFAGLYMLHRLRKSGLRAVVLEAGADVGGTWYWNRYPGARCDVESMQYSYSFDEELQQEWHWTERYASQPEILRYINHVADRFDLRRDIRFGRRVTKMRWNKAEAFWSLVTDTGEQIAARFAVMATGPLSVARAPDIAGIGDFQGEIFYTGTWPHREVSFEGRSVGVLGTGSSGIQVIPKIAEAARHLTVFQRTANFSLPARNAPLDSKSEAAWKKDYTQLRAAARKTERAMLRYQPSHSVLETEPAERERMFDEGWQRGGLDFTRTFTDLLTDDRANALAAEFVRTRIAEIVKDTEKAEVLKPRRFPLGARRICLDTNYFETFNRPNVALVDLNAEPLVRLTASGVQTRQRHYEIDALVLATGFDAMIGALSAIHIEGPDETLAEKWARGIKNHLGLMPAGFPNLFTVNGPGSPGVLCNVVAAIEHHVEWMSDCIAYLYENGFRTIESNVSDEDGWMEYSNTIASKTLFMKSMNSWHVSPDAPGRPRTLMPFAGSFADYAEVCRSVASDGYRGFTLGR